MAAGPCGATAFAARHFDGRLRLGHALRISVRVRFRAVSAAVRRQRASLSRVAKPCRGARFVAHRLADRPARSIRWWIPRYGTTARPSRRAVAP